MIRKEDALANIEGTMNKFWETLAYAAPEMWQEHWNNFQDTMRYEIETIYADDSESDGE